jgi:hypothetical protein
MKKILSELDYPPEQFPESPISVLEAMESTKQAYLAQELFERLVGENRHKEAAKVGKILQWQFNIDLSN